MKDVVLHLPTFGFIVSTRAALGAGIGLMLADRLADRRRRTLGATLIAIGAATTIPALAALIRGRRRAREASSGVSQDPRLRESTRFPRKGDDVY